MTDSAEGTMIRRHPSGAGTEWFRLFAERVAHALGSPWAFLIAVSSVAVWAATGPSFRFSSTWQMIINTATTIVTFLMVFLIQNTQNRDSRAIHLKLDELLRAVQEARTGLVSLEQRPDAELQELAEEFRELSQAEGAADGGVSAVAGSQDAK